MTKTISTKDMIVIGLMLFALFFGAGNLVFPVMLGQLAGTAVSEAAIGFLLTGVGLPLLGVIAFSISGQPDLLSLTNRVHPIFGLIFTTTLYLTIGPLFAMPRTGSVSYEIAIKPFLTEQDNAIPLFLFTISFFALSCFLSLNPSKMIDIVGKWLTPLLITFMAILALTTLLYPLGQPMAPQVKYESYPFFQGFQEGYLTMDALAALVFGIIVINAIKDKGAHSPKLLLQTGIKSSILAAAILAVIYFVLAYIGASSVEKLNYLANGGEVLAQISQHYYGTYGGIILGIIVLLACLTTAIGLTTACSSYLQSLIPHISYKTYAVLLSLVSALLANAGLNDLIQISEPVLKILYPLAIVLMLLTFFHPLFKGKRQVYWFSLTFTFLVSIVEGLSSSKLKIVSLTNLYSDYLPLFDIGLGWIIPALIGAILGFIWPVSKRRNEAI
ncbi:branched-chain amino acid transport system II carrier protein [Paenibacillus yanchengensis]|uniref:Branched-chain amino acid transport system carrier protein n=1 Tax=Paenibacillus yanchengensis TaxID=2035833 RepID=A0ABW4YR91_9BACL